MSELRDRKVSFPLNLLDHKLIWESLFSWSIIKAHFLFSIINLVVSPSWVYNQMKLYENEKETFIYLIKNAIEEDENGDEMTMMMMMIKKARI